MNMREMIFIMIYVSFDMVLGAYLIGNMTTVIVKGSKTEKCLRPSVIRLKEAAVLQDIPILIRTKV